MKQALLLVGFVLGSSIVLGTVHLHTAATQVTPLANPGPIVALAETAHSASDTNISRSNLLAQEDDEPIKLQPFDQVIKGTERLEGLFTLYRQAETGKVYLELQPQQLNVNYLCTITLESGVGEAGIYGGMPLADFLFTFQRVNQRVQFLVPNVFFRTLPNDPMQRSVQRSFSNSVLQALPIRSIHPQRKSLLVELGPLLLNDLPGLSQILSQAFGTDYTIDASKSHFGTIKAFPLNLEVESVYGFDGSSSPQELPAFFFSVPDSRNLSLRVRYSLSQLPTNNGYQPRLADDRIGYFITAYQNLSDNSPEVPFVRYINRWHLEKQDQNAPLSPPKQPIVFWIENTVPLEYRDAVRDGILMWNKAFEQAGFSNAIEAKQMPDQADWDPADIRYNTIRWFSAFESGLLGQGPSRVNPLTGQILDADILINASFARYTSQQFESLVQPQQMNLMRSLAQLSGKPNLCNYGLPAHLMQQTITAKPPAKSRLAFKPSGDDDLCYGIEASRQFAIGSLSLNMLHYISPKSPEMKQYVQDFLRSLVAHEVGHTLGLRHNFQASTMLPPEQLNNQAITRQKGLLASVMDYPAVNIAPPETPQGDYFTHSIGPYDAWAIEYGYKPSGMRSPTAETRFLNQIARRAPEPELAYATDEDMFADLDPNTQPFDLSGNLLTYAPWQFDNARLLWQRLDQNYPRSGESFNEVRVLFDDIFDYYFQYARFLTTFIGGQSFNRYRSGDAAGRLPFEPIALEQQRQALTLLQQYVFDESKFRFSPVFLNKLAPSRWFHWGEIPQFDSLEYPIYDRILVMQAITLRRLLSNDRLTRLRDAELKTHNQTLTIPDLLNFLQTTIWREVLQPEENLTLSSLRRGLQREHLNQMIRMVLYKVPVPDDARTVARYELKQLRTALETQLRRKSKQLDVVTRAHLEEVSDRITKALDAELQSQ